MLLRGLLLIALGVCGVAHGFDLNGYKLYELTPTSVAQCQQLAQLSTNAKRYDFLTLSRLPNRAARLMVHPEEHGNFRKFVAAHAIPAKLLNEDVGAVVRHDFELNKRLKAMHPYMRRQGRLSTERYYTHDEINAYIEDLAERYPSRVFIKMFGKSYEGRQLKTIQITNGDGRVDKKVILMDGGFHAREWISPATVVYVIGQLVENYAENADLLLDYDWVIMPVVNPDGYEYSQLSPDTRMWRKTRQPLVLPAETCYGTDPNRNFDFHWNEEGASSYACDTTFAGPKAFSEPEAVVMRDIMHSFKGRGIMYLTIHSYGNYLLYPWGWSSDLPDTWRDLDEVARAGGDAIFEATGTEYAVGSSTNVLYVAAGASDDYAFHVGFPISITMELPGGGSNGFDPPPTSIDAFVKESWIGIRAMGRKVVAKY